MMDAAGYSTERMIGWSRVTGEQHAWNVALAGRQLVSV